MLLMNFIELERQSFIKEVKSQKHFEIYVAETNIDVLFKFPAISYTNIRDLNRTLFALDSSQKLS